MVRPTRTGPARPLLSLGLGTTYVGGGSTATAVDVSITDAGDYYDATDVENALQELAAKAIGFLGHGALGSTETFDAAIGHHLGTLDANCTFTLVGSANDTASWLFIELEQDGTGGWAITLPGSVVNAAEIEAGQDTTAGGTTFLGLYSRDGGTTWYGGWWAMDTDGGLLNNYSATAAPTVNDDSGDGYSVGSIWVDVTNDDAYILVDASSGAAIWNPFESAGGSPAPADISGGTSSSSGGYDYHLFTADGTLTVTTPGSVEVLLVGAGGGGGGYFSGGGGGGGQVLLLIDLFVDDDVAVVIGAAGDSGSGSGAVPASRGAPGGFSSITSTPFGTLYAAGGGGGGGQTVGGGLGEGRDGGNGGGAGTRGSNPGGVSVVGGFSGGTSRSGAVGGTGAGGGGGGASANGANAGASDVGGAGGAGATVSEFSGFGASGVYGGGGGGGGVTTGGNGGTGGGGHGGATSSNTGMTAGTANTGGGGGGGGNTGTTGATGGDGGTGVVIFRVPS